MDASRSKRGTHMLPVRATARRGTHISRARQNFSETHTGCASQDAREIHNNDASRLLCETQAKRASRHWREPLSDSCEPLCL
jgi:hypothetical protein